MAIYSIPVHSRQGHYKFKTVLKDIPLIFTFRFNYRASRWIMSISDDEGTLIVSSIPLSLNVDIIAQYPHIGLPVGILLCASAINEQVEITRENFGSDIKMYFNDLED